MVRRVRPAAPRFGPAAGAALVAAGLAAAVVPRPADLVEQYYGRRIYPALQRVVTSMSNVIPVALFDVVIVVAAAWCLWWWTTAFRAAWTRGTMAPLGLALLATGALGAAGYLWFLGAWGLNYARPPLDVRLGLPAGPPSDADVASLLALAVDGANDGYAPAHAADAGTADEAVARALHRVEARQGRAVPTVPGRPKLTLLAPYFRVAGVDGLTAPLALETLLNPDLLAVERPFVLAHEWAHLSGYAPEADANFVAWLSVTASDHPLLQYSGWLFLLSETARQVGGDARREALDRLADGPRRDLAAIAERATRWRVDLVERVGWRVYDRYLRAQGVDEGVRSYSRVVEFIVRARRAAAGAPSRP
ncbi:MAG: DUF3810 family protein [Vicinamibacterales bacterium]